MKKKENSCLYLPYLYTSDGPLIPKRHVKYKGTAIRMIQYRANFQKQREKQNENEERKKTFNNDKMKQLGSSSGQ